MSTGTPEFSEARRALLEKYLPGALSQTTKAEGGGTPDSGEEALSRARVLTIQTGGSRRPFFFLHGQWEEGKSYHCYPLAQALGSDQPFYGLDPYSLDGRQSLPSMEGIAAAHVKAMRAVQPEGPYLLGGWCNGGLVAYEMARQLQARGQTVDLLVLMDPEFLVYPLSFRFYRGAFRRLGGVLRLGEERQLNWYLRLKHVSRVARMRLLGREDPEHLAFADLRQNYPRLLDWIALGYAPASLYTGKITFFWTNDENQERPSRKGWRKVEAHTESEVHLIPGNHITSRTVYLPALADQLDRCIRKAQAPASK